MRPVVKFQVTDPTIIPPIAETYNPYQSAKPDLERNIGCYCSYCESVITDEAMHVEHIQPHSLLKYGHLKYAWSNFLVSCHRCNGKDNKSDKDVIFADIHMPHLNNTFKSITYYEDGRVEANTRLTGNEYNKAQSLIELVGLDKMLGHPQHNAGDKRAERRKIVWVLANRYRNDYEKNHTNLTPQIIVDLAIARGFWSVWMEVFKRHQEIQDLLIQSFPSTYVSCRIKNINRK